MIKQTATLSLDPGTISGLIVLNNQYPFNVLFKKTINCKKVSLSGIVRDLKDALADKNIIIEHAVIENQYIGINPKSGLVLAQNAGQWKEACLSSKIPVEFIYPTTWQFAMLKGLIKRNSKRQEIEKYCAIVTGQLFKKNLSPHINDAYLMGLYYVKKNASSNMLKNIVDRLSKVKKRRKV